MSLAELLKQKVETLARETKAAEEEAQRAVKKMSELRQRLSAYTSALNAETHGTNGNKPTPTIAASLISDGAATTNGYKNTTNFIHDLIVTHADKGITAVDIWNKVHSNRPECSRNYIYAVLYRLTGKNLVEMHDNRYFPVTEGK